MGWLGITILPFSIHFLNHIGAILFCFPQRWRIQDWSSPLSNALNAGFAYVGGACVVNKRLEKVNSVAIVEDTGGFSGIIVAAHEVGHL